MARWTSKSPTSSFPLRPPSPVSPPFIVGGFTNPAFQAEGIFDDVVVAPRAWTAVEVESAYTRHALGLTVRLRTCAEPDCSDDPPFGQALQDDGPELQAPIERDVSSSLGRYVQYEVELTTEGSLSPAFGHVVLDVTE